jgi:hypothetical protein
MRQSVRQQARRTNQIMANRDYKLYYDGQLRSSHPTTIDAVRFAYEIQKADYKNKGIAQRFEVKHPQQGLIHEEEGYIKEQIDETYL